jgi:hypothetical protein
MKDNFGITRVLRWLRPEPDSTELAPYWEYSDRYGRTWLVPA